MSQLTKQDSIFLPLVAGALGGGVAKTITAPLDRVHIEFQTNSSAPFNFHNMVGYVRSRVQHAGVLSLWRGNSFTLIRVVPFAAVNYGSHEQFKRWVGVELDNPLKTPAWKRLFAGSMAGVSATTFTYPLEVARSRMAVTERETYDSMRSIVRTMTREGLQSFYRGFVPTMMGSFMYSGISFYVYETLDARYTQYLRRKRQKQYAVDNKQLPKSSKDAVIHIDSWKTMLMGSFAGFLGQTVSYPFDILRKRMQTISERPFDIHDHDSSSFRNLNAAEKSSLTSRRPVRIMTGLRAMISEQGWRVGLFKGLTLNWIKGPLVVGISFVVYEKVIEWAHRYGITGIKTPRPLHTEQ